MDQDNIRHSLFQWQPRRRAVQIRCRKLPTVRLGGKKCPRKVGLRLMRIWRKIRLRCILNKLKEYHRRIVTDIIAAGASYEGFQQRLITETTGTVPISVGLNRFPSVARQRAIIM